METLAIHKEELPYTVKEELKGLRSNIMFCGDKVQSVLLTSCLDSEGKSTISLELARSFAELGKETLLLDTDLRNSVILDKIEECQCQSIRCCHEQS